MALTKLSPGNVAQAVYDDSSESIKVSLVGSGSPTLPNIVQLSDGTANLTSTVIGSDRALDVNIVNGLELTISHLDDSIKLGDGTGLITSTVSGGKRALDVSILGGISDVNGEFTQQPNGITVLTYGTQSIASAATSIVAQYIIPAGNPTYVQKMYVSGDCVGKFTVYKNSSVILVIRLSHTTPYIPIDFSTNTAFGLLTSPGDVIKIEAENLGTITAIFDATIQTMNT